MSAKLKPVAEKPLTLAISVKGEIVKSNFPEFREWAEERIAAINFDLTTDEDFGQAKLDEKSLKEFEEKLGEAEERALREMDEVYALINGTRELKGYAREKRLELSKKVKARAEEIRAELLKDGYAALDHDCRKFRDLIDASIKGKSSLEKMREAISEVVEEANSEVAKIRTLFKAAMEEHGDAVAYGEKELLSQDPESVRIELERRVERHRAALREAALKAEAEKLRKEAEEKARKEAEAARAAAEAEPQAKQPEFPASNPAQTPEPNPESVVKVAIATESDDPAEEMEAFKATLRSALAPVKAARAALKHPENIKAGEEFARLMTAAMKPLNIISR